MYVGKEFTTTLGGEKVVPVACEKCATHFHYVLARVGTGSASAPFFLFQNSATNRASAAAQQHLQKRLEREAELVPCPQCRWVNQDLVNRYRRMMYRRAWILIIALMVAGFVIAPAAASAAEKPFGADGAAIAMIATFALFLLSPIWVLLIRRRLRFRIDPNRTHPNWPVLPPGTPLPLLERVDPETQETFFEAVPRPAATEMGEWAIFRTGQMQLPEACCVCLGPWSTTYGSPFKVNETSDVAVPLCGECASILKRRWWGIALVVAAFAFAIAGLVASLIPRVDSTGRTILFCVVGLFATLFGIAIIPSHLCRPYRLKMIDPQRGIFKFAAKNPGYTARLIAQSRLTEGLDE